MLGTSNPLLAVVGGWVRQADAGLARTAVRNAEAGVESDRARRLDEARTLRDLRTLAAREAGRRGDPVPAQGRRSSAGARPH